MIAHLLLEEELQIGVEQVMKKNRTTSLSIDLLLLRELEQEKLEIEKELQHISDAAKDCLRLGQKDFSVRINAYTED